MRLLMISTTLLALLGAMVPACAQTSFEPGFYFGANGGSATVSNKYADDNDDVAFGYNAGYQFTRNYGFELYARNLSFNPFRGFLADAGYYPSFHYGASMLASVAAGDKMSLYGRAGIGSTTLNGTRSDMADKHEVDPSVGVGVRLAFNRRWSMIVEDMYLTKSEVNLISVGVRHQF